MKEEIAKLLSKETKLKEEDITNKNSALNAGMSYSKRIKYSYAFPIYLTHKTYRKLNALDIVR
jgi:hypothetical protein